MVALASAELGSVAEHCLVGPTLCPIRSQVFRHGRDTEASTCALLFLPRSPPKSCCAWAFNAGRLDREDGSLGSVARFPFRP